MRGPDRRDDMDTKTTIGIGAALVGAVALGMTLAAFSVAQQSDQDKAEASAVAQAPVDPLGDAPAASTLKTTFSDRQEEDIRAIIRDTLMADPEIIIEAVNLYGRQQQALAEAKAQTSAKEYLPALLDPADGFVAGAKGDKAKVAVIELFDYHCGFCKRAAPLVNELIKNENDVQVVFREYPILREESDYAAEIALAAREQNKFLEMHFAMMEASGILTKDRLREIAAKENVNFTKLEAERGNADVSQAIIDTIEIAQAMGIQGTPAFVIASMDGDYIKVIEGFRPEDVMNAVSEARAAQ